VPDLTGCPVPVVCHYVKHNSSAAGTIAFIWKFLVINAFQFSGSLLNVSGNIVHGHIVIPGLLDNSLQAGIGIRVTAALLDGYDNFLANFGIYLGLLGILPAFSVFYIGPFGMA